MDLLGSWKSLLTICIYALLLNNNVEGYSGKKSQLYYIPRCKDRTTILNTCFEKSSQDMMFYLNRTGHGISEDVLKEKCIELRSSMSTCINDNQHICMNQLGKIYDIDFFGSPVFHEALCHNEIVSTARIRHEDCILLINDDVEQCRDEYVKEKGAQIKKTHDICCSNNFVSNCLKRVMQRKCRQESAELISKALNSFHFSDACDDVLCSSCIGLGFSSSLFIVAVVLNNILKV